MNTNIPQSDILIGQTALKIAAWADAKVAFEKALCSANTPEIHDGLGIALWWLNDIEAAHHHRTVAYNGFKTQGDLGRAAFIACWLAREQIFLNANFLAMQGWFARAEYLINQLEVGLERAWFSMLQASVTAKPSEMVTIAFQTLVLARQQQHSDLEAFALAFYGQAMVTLGYVDTGMVYLDEAMTMATNGEVTDFSVMSEVFCVMLSTCEIAGDLARSEVWCRSAADFAQRHQCPFLSAYCRTAYGGLMTALGRWQTAETALVEAIQAFESGHKGLRIHAVIKLADLRICQGRLEEAAVMLAGMEDQEAALVPMARLLVQKGETALARAMLEQALSSVSSYRLDHLPIIFLLIEILLTMGDAVGTQRFLDDLVGFTEQVQSKSLKAHIEFLRGRVHHYLGDITGAKASFNIALDYLEFYEHSLLAGQVRLNMAQMLQNQDPIGAVAWAKGALATFERIGATPEKAKANALLRQLGINRGVVAHQQKPLTSREVEIASLIALGLTNREIANRLVVSPKTVEHHVSNILGKLNLRRRSEVAALSAKGWNTMN